MRPLPTIWLISFVLYSSLYLLTSQRDISWQDSGEYQLRVSNNDFAGPGGLARSHPLYIYMGIALKSLPGGITSLPFKLNAFSGLGMAIALANLAGLIVMLTGKKWVAFAGPAMVSVLHTVWWLSTVAEVYTWSVAGLTAELWLLILLFREPNWKYLTALAFVNGMGLAIHNFALLTAPIYFVAALILVHRKRIGLSSLLAAAAAFFVGASPYLVRVVEEAIRNGSVSNTIASALVGTFPNQVFNPGGLSEYSLQNFVLIGQNALSLVLPLSLLGFLGLNKFMSNTTANLVRAITVIELAFVVRYNVPDQFTFMLPVLVLMGFLASLCLAEWDTASSRMRKIALIGSVCSIVFPPVFYGLSPTILKNMGINIDREGHPRDELRYWLTPWKHDEQSARVFSEKAVSFAQPDGVILCNQTAFYPLNFYVNAQATDVKVENSNLSLISRSSSVPEIRKTLGQRPLFVLERADIPKDLAPYVGFERPAGDVLFKVIWR
ncbi:MAG TPA: DUF2723 domain-containing protein [Bacteroidota bacterium]|nr:DUF2723 domain-containing protein [Bacteroidota bacterium]